MSSLHPAIRPAISPYGPHPTGGGFVGTYVQHSYEPSRPSYHHIPAMRPAQDAESGYSTTPIYDALYSEYRRSFRALPGDRSGEEDLGFKGFGALAAAQSAAAHGAGSHGTGLATGTHSASGTHGYGQGHQAPPSSRPGHFFRPRFSRTRTDMWIGVPSKPNSSRSRRSTNRR